MRLTRLFPLLALVMGAIAFVACSDDDPKPQGKGSEVNKEVVGTYAGWTHLKTTYLDRNYANDTLTLALADDGTLTGTFTDATWGVATIKGIQASKIEAGEGYTLAGGEGSFVMNNPRQGGTQEFACKLESGTVSGSKQQMIAVISAYMEVGHGDMTFTFHTGEMLTDDE